MPSKRFEKAAVLAEKLKTWNHNDVALAVKESLETESQNSWVYGVADSRVDNILETQNQINISADFDNPMECFYSFVMVGLQPPPEVVICVGKCIGNYFQNGGKISLDKAFFGNDHVALKSYAKSNYDKSLNSKYAFFEAIKDYSSRKSLEGKAEEFLSTRLDDYSTDIHSFLKGYDRWKSIKNK